MMDIELYLILSAAYEYTKEPMPQEDADASRLRRYISGGIETYFHKHGYIYESDTHAWKADIRTAQAKLDEIARHRTQGAKDGWEIRRGKQKSKNDKELL